MTATSGLRRSELSVRWDRDTSSWKTYQVSFLHLLTGEPQRMGEPWSESLPKSGTVSIGEQAELKMWAHPTNASGGGALGWPTPRESESYQGDGAAQGYKEAGFKQPTHRYDKDGKLVLRSEYGKTGQGTFDTTLTTAVTAVTQNWPTPRSGNPGSRQQGTGGKVLNQEAQNWPTPVAREDRAERYTETTSERHLKEGRQVHLSEEVRMQNWPTPNVRDYKETINSQPNKQEHLVDAIRANWATPRVGGQEGYETRAKRLGHDGAMSHLESQVEYIQGNWPTPTASSPTPTTWWSAAGPPRNSSAWGRARCSGASAWRGCCAATGAG